MTARGLIAGVLLALGAWFMRRGAGVGADPAAAFGMGDSGADPALAPVAAPGSDQWTVAQTIWGEARGQGRLGMQAVADVIRNRVNSGVTWWGRGWSGVCRAPRQFSVWNAGDPNRAKMEAVTAADASFALALAIAGDAISGALPPVTGGATHYYNPSVVSPTWAASLSETAVIGSHRFLV